jgi:DNA uptake protein ComE-like DNA-binding protein
MKHLILVASALALVGCAKRDAASDTTAVAGMDSTKIGATTQPAPTQTATGGDVTRTAGGSGGLVDPNTATREQLASAGVDTATIAVIIAGRPYVDMVAVNAAVGNTLSTAQRNALYAKVWKPIDLNTAKPDEILLIPGVGPRMLHEFQEYRPYKNIDQFRREIGKYVKKDEVARLERYVTVK